MESFIVRVYRVDRDDRRKIVGLVEATDGSDRQEAFADIDELGKILNGLSLPTGSMHGKGLPTIRPGSRCLFLAKGGGHKEEP